MYNTSFICTYSFYDSKLRSSYHENESFDLEDVEEFEELADIIYKAELLQILNMQQDFYQNKIHFNETQMKFIYDKMKSCEGFMLCVEKIKQVNLCITLEQAFCFLFSYDYLFLTHKCICEFLTSGKICDVQANTLLCAIK